MICYDYSSCSILGEFGTVYQGSWKEKGKQIPIAVKTLRVCVCVCGCMRVYVCVWVCVCVGVCVGVGVHEGCEGAQLSIVYISSNFESRYVC